MGDDVTIRLDSEEYVLRREGGDLRVGRRVDGGVTWLDTVDTGLFSAPAREALERGDTADAELVTALRGVVQAESQRGA
ncbi:MULTISPECIES: hypothetical protein [unclassified Geodermatophilus]|uniref:hypothetical protein n=1 Tax=unclassified Geodermatophilus TaxID=2637632 RepID=UPI003EEB2E65